MASENPTATYHAYLYLHSSSTFIGSSATFFSSDTLDTTALDLTTF